MLPKKRFSRKKEKFVCLHCGKETQGNGYTDHCPYCLWSRHVDINPGDRLAKCKGLMEPIRALREGDNIIIYYKCLKCGIEKRVKAAKEDNKELLYQLINAGINK